MERTCTTKLIIRMLSILQHHAHVLRCCFLLTDWVCSSSQQVCNAVSASSTHSAFSLSNICLDSTAAPSKSAQRRARPSATWRHDVTHQKIYVYATVRDAAIILNIVHVKLGLLWMKMTVIGCGVVLSIVLWDSVAYTSLCLLAARSNCCTHVSLFCRRLGSSFWKRR